MSVSIKSENLRSIRFKDIKAATKNFTNILGRGGYGPVYKGELSISGNLTTVAVKRLPDNDASGQGLKEFLTEIHLLSHYEHPNLISLIGYCEEGREKILIYEYAENGSFDNYLKTECPLTWKQRVKICIDAARGLEYLHNGVGEKHRIIHRDIKSANILLDGNLKAKIADLGLSKIGRANETETFLITNVGGTLGYCDPVYLKTGILTKKSDVYSFGVVLFEALCGRLCFNDVPDENRHLVPLARRLYAKGKLDMIMDLDLKGSESVKNFSEIAYICLNNDRESRPSMDVVLQRLEKALQLLESEEECELQKLEEALGLQILVQTLQYQEFVESLILQDLEEALELQELMDTMDLYKLQGIVDLQTDYAVIKLINMVANTTLTWTTKEEIFSYFSTGTLVHRHKVWCCIDDNGKNQEMISPLGFKHTSPLNNKSYRLISMDNSRFTIAAKIFNASNLNMQVKIRTQFLSSDVIYAAYLIVKHVNDQKSLLPIIEGLKYKLNDETESHMSYIRDYKDNGWSMMELFQTNCLKRNVEFSILLEEFHCAPYWANAEEVLLEGILFLPIQKFDGEQIIKHEVADSPSSEVKWEKLLPSDYEQFIYYSDKRLVKQPPNFLIRETKEEAYSILSRGIYIKDTTGMDMWFWITQSSGKKCVMLSPRSIIHSSNKDHIRELNESRFRSVLEISSSDVIRISFRIENPFLATKTIYGCYLVYKLPQCLETPVKVFMTQTLNLPRGEKNLGNRTYVQEKLVYLSTPQSPLIGLNDIERSPSTMNKPKMVGYPRKRKDGWSEVRLVEFITHDQQWIENVPSWIYKCIPWISNDLDHVNGKDDATIQLATLCPHYDPVITISLSCIKSKRPYFKIENLIVQGVEFRPI